MEPWKAEKQLATETAAFLVERNFPQLSPVTIQQVGEGWDNFVFLANSCYIFRFARRQIAVPLLEMEHSLLPVLSSQVSLPIPIPKFFAIADLSEYHWPFMGYEMIPGTTACRARLSQDQYDAMAPALGKFLKELHSFPVLQALELGVKYDQLQRLDVERRLAKCDEWWRQIETSNCLQKEKIEKMRTFMADCRDIAIPEQACLLHGDLYVRHILVDSDTIRGVIDWGDLCIGHPAIDLSLMFALFSEPGRNTFIRAYGEVDAVTLKLARFRAACHYTMILGFAIGAKELELLHQSLFAIDNILRASA